jgi:hypothetical protein
MRRSHLKSCGSLDWPEFEKSYPVIHVLVGMSKDLFKLESDMGLPFEKSDTWRDLVKWMYNPFSVDPLGTDNPKRAARVSHRLGRQACRLMNSPEAMSKLMSRVSRSPFQDSGLILTLRVPGGLREARDSRVDHSEYSGQVWNQRLGKWEKKAGLPGLPGFLTSGGPWFSRPHLSLAPPLLLGVSVTETCPDFVWTLRKGGSKCQPTETCSMVWPHGAYGCDDPSPPR